MQATLAYLTKHLSTSIRSIRTPYKMVRNIMPRQEAEKINSSIENSTIKDYYSPYLARLYFYHL